MLKGASSSSTAAASAAVPPPPSDSEEWPALPGAAPKAPKPAVAERAPRPRNLPPPPPGLEPPVAEAASPLKPSLLLPHLTTNAKTPAPQPPQPRVVLSPDIKPVGAPRRSGSGSGSGGRLSLPTLVEHGEDEEEEDEEAAAAALFRLESPLLRGLGPTREPALLSFEMLDLDDDAGAWVGAAEGEGVEDDEEDGHVLLFKRQVAADPGAC